MIISMLCSLVLTSHSHARMPEGIERGEQLNKAVVAEIRKLSSAVEVFTEEHHEYPTSGRRVLAVSAALSDLVPHYLPSIPSKDPFGGTYIYWSNGSDYFII